MKNLATVRLYLFLMFVLIFAPLTGRANAQPANPEVVTGGVEDSAQVDGLAKVKRMVSDRFGASNLMNVQPYFGLDGQYSGNSFEFFVPALNESVSAIYDLSSDSPRVAALWTGLPMHSDPERLSKASESVFDTFGVAVGNPECICWLGGLNVWAIYSAVDPKGSDRIACNLFDFQSTTYGQIEQQGISGKTTKRARRKAPQAVITLQNNVPVTNLSGSKYSEAHYKIAVPSSTTRLDITITGGIGDCDLYVKRGQQASTTIYDYRPYLSGNNEAVPVNSPASGDWYIMLRGYTSYSGVTLKAAYTGNSTYVLSVRPEKLEYLPGQKAVFTGSLKTSSGQAVTNSRIGVDDPIEQICKLGPYTDYMGNFRYESSSNSSSAGVYALTFYGGSAKAFCMVQIKDSFGFQISNPNHIVNLGATLNTSDIDFAYNAKIGNGLRQSTPQELLDADNKITTFMAGTGKTALIDFVSNPLNDVAALASGACVAGVWTGVGTIPCAAVYKWMLKSAAKSLTYAAIVQSIEMSNLTPAQKLYWKTVAKPGFKCVTGIAFLDPKRSVINDIKQGLTGWSCGQATAVILNYNNQDALRIAAIPTTQSQSQASMAVVLVPIQESELPSVSSITPTSGVVGVLVTINGSRFGAMQGANSVKFGTAVAAITSWSDTKIVATAPAGNGAVNVAVTTTAGTSNGVAFAYNATIPTITSISPTSGTVGTSVTINGNGFGATQGGSAVKFGTALATITSWTETKIVAIAPAGSGTTNVAVTTTAGTSNGVAFTYNVAIPAITSISPTSGIAGTSVTVNGSRFGAMQGTNLVKFGTAVAAISSWGDTKIVVTAPAGNGMVNITVTTTAGTSNGVPFTYKTVQSERIANGSFSSGSSGWTLGGDFWAGTNLTNYRTAPGYAAGGVDRNGYPKNRAYGYLYQTVTIPSNATSATLSFWYYITSAEISGAYDTLSVMIQNSSGNYLATVAVLGNANKGSAYSQKTFDVTTFKGQTIRINFLATTDISNTTVFRIDDVSLMSDGN